MNIKVGDKVKPSRNCRTLYGDPNYMVVTEIKDGKVLTDVYSILFDEGELEKIETVPENIESFSHTETPLQFQIRAYEILQERFAELQQANKALALQNEVLSGAYETSQRRVNELEAEIEKLNSPPDFFTLKKAQ